MKKNLKEYSLITLGCILYAFGVMYFYVPNKLGEGGVTGISLIFNYLWKFKISYTYAILNIPLLILGWRMLGGEFIAKTFYGVFAVSLFIKIFSFIGAPMQDMLLATIFGGIVTGAGLGIVFLNGGSTGGIDIIARIMTKYKGVSIGKALLAIDCIILCLAGFLFGKTIFMYTLVAMSVAAKVVDFVMEGRRVAKSVIVISSKTEEITNFIITNLERSATILNGVGAYTNQERPVIYSIMSRYEIFRFKKFVASVDDKAFIIVSDASEVLGEGFKNLKEDE